MTEGTPNHSGIIRAGIIKDLDYPLFTILPPDKISVRGPGQGDKTWP